jgi:hypothetical protein
MKFRNPYAGQRNASVAKKQRVVLDAQLVGMQALQQSIEAMQAVLTSTALTMEAGATVIKAQALTQQALAEALAIKAGPHRTVTVRGQDGHVSEMWNGPKKDAP